MNPFSGPPLIEMMMQANSEIVDNTLKILSRGVGQSQHRVFQYDRLQVKFDSTKEPLKTDMSMLIQNDIAKFNNQCRQAQLEKITVPDVAATLPKQ